MAAGRTPTPQSHAALAELCELYWSPLYSYARRRGYDVEQAQDLTQAFFTRLLEKHAVEAADPARGRFQSFLLASFKNFIAGVHEHDAAKKRGDGRPPISLEFDAAEGRYVAEPGHLVTPEALFEQQWAVGVLERVHRALRAEAAKAGKQAIFDQVKDVLSGDKLPGGYAALAQTLDTTEGALKVMIHRLRRRFGELLRAEIAATVSDPTEIDDEIQHLIGVLGK